MGIHTTSLIKCCNASRGSLAFGAAMVAMAGSQRDAGGSDRAEQGRGNWRAQERKGPASLLSRLNLDGRANLGVVWYRQAKGGGDVCGAAAVV